MPTRPPSYDSSRDSHPRESEPLPPPSIPTALWSDADVDVPVARRAPISPAHAAAPGDPLATIGHIGRYAIKYCIGEGGLGTVYAAHDPLLSRLIAIKTLNLQISVAQRPAFNAMFLNEARAAAGLSHPHIVTVFDAGVSDNNAYIAMELLKGRDLRQLRKEGWRPTAVQAALIVRRVADALAYAHSKGVVHRDIKPANIFMVGRTQPRVLDFGIARLAHQHDTHSGDDIVGGSPYYMSPEQIRQQPVDRRTDVFSLGVVLYELLADVKPFRGNSLAEITNAVIENVPLPAHTVNPGVPRGLSEIAARAMEKDPGHRFRSARALSRELRAWLEEYGQAAEGADLLGPPPHRSKALWAVRGSAMLALAVAAGWAAWLHKSAAPVAAAVPAGAPAAGPAAPAVPEAPTAAAPAKTSVAAAPAAVAVEPARPAQLPATGAESAAATVQPPVAAPSPASHRAPPPVLASTAPPVRPVAAAAAHVLPAPAGASPATASAAGALAVSDSRTASLAPAKDAVKPAAAVANKGVKVPAKLAAKDVTRDKQVREMHDARAAAAAPSATGTVKLAITPWGQIEVDGNALGTAPPLSELVLGEGQHRVTIRNTDFPPYNADISITAGQAVMLKYRFGS